MLGTLAWGTLVLAQSAVATPSPKATKWPTPVFKYGGDTEGGAPYSFYDPDHPDQLVGVDVEIAEEIAKRVGAKPLFFQNQWAALIPALKRKDCDSVINGLEVTPDRAEEVDFSRPYYVFQEELTVRKDDDTIHSLQDLQGHKVGTLSGALSRQILDQVPKIQILTYDDVLEPYKDLELGRTDAVLLDVPIAVFYAHPDPKIKQAGPPIAQGLYAAAVRKGDHERLDAIDAAIGSMIDDGTLKKILEKWGMWNQTQEELVRGRELTDLFSKKTFEDLEKSGEVPTPPKSISTQAAGEATAPSVHKPKSYWVYLPDLLRGAGMTLILTVLSFALAVLVGLPLALVRIYAPPPIRAIAVAYIEVMRGTPLLLQLYVLYYGATNVGLNLSALSAAILGLGLNYAAYEAEVYRAAITSVPLGQTEAAFSLGMSRLAALRYIILPQAVRIAMPPSTNDFIALFKDSSLVSVITVVELTKQFQIDAAATYSYGELGAMTAVLYLAMSVPLAYMARRMEHTIAVSQGVNQ